jgi:4-amino-4-deoxy-L-arabinose transferase-like glycosyltransferase
MNTRSASQDLRDTSVQRDSAPLRFLVAMAAYFLAHLVLRISVPGSLERDEAEIVYLTQQLRLGYGSQPPLYAWLQWMLFSVFGLNRFALVVLKDFLLVATYVGMYRTALPLVGVHGALAAAISLVLFPQIGWESLRDLTHSVLLTTLACGTLWCYFALLRTPSASRYALFGVLAGLGLQTKYNFVIFLTGLCCASLLVREHRQALWNRKVAIAVVLAVLVILPHGVWLLDNLQGATAGTLRKMAEGTEGNSYAKNVAQGLSSLLLAAVAFAAPLVAVYAAVCYRYRRQMSVSGRTPEGRFFVCLYGSFLVLLIGIVFTGDIGKIKDRWMMPLLFSVPLAFFVMLPSLPRRAVFDRVWRVCAAIALAFLVVLPLRTYFGPAWGKVAPPHHPYPQLAAELERRFPQVTTVVTGGTLIAGNIHFEQPAWRTLLLEQVLQPDATLEGEVLLVMYDGADPGWLERFRSRYPQATLRAQGRLSLGYRFGGAGQMVFEYVHVTLGGG